MSIGTPTPPRTTTADQTTMASAPNTPTSYYLDTPAVQQACKQDFEKIDKACAPENEGNSKNRHPALKKLLGPKRLASLENMAKGVKDKTGFSPNAGNAWMSHCDGLWVKPDMGNYKAQIDEFNQQIQAMSDDIGGAIKSQLEPLIEQVGEEVKQKAIQAAKDKAVKAGVRSGARWGVGLAGAAVGGVGAVVTEVVATAWNIVDWVGTGYDAIKLGSEAYGAIKEMSTVLDLAAKAQDELASLAKAAAGKSPTELMGDGMGVLSRFNPCTRARRCKLVPYNKTGTAQSIGGDGCCPGQTGHHVIPEEAAGSACSGYSHGGAPTICVEGTNNSNGSHGAIHSNLERRLAKHRDSFFGGDTISYGKMRDKGIDSVQSTFPESKCDEKCLRAQLDAYYKDKCTAPMPAASGAPATGSKTNSSKKRR